MIGKAAHRRQACTGFGFAVVIGVGVDVIDVSHAVRIKNEFEGRHIQMFLRHHRLHPRDKRPAEIALAKPVDDVEGEAWLGIRHAGVGIQRADIGRAQFEPVAGVDAHGIDKLTADKFNPGDGLVRSGDITLNKRDSIH